MSDETWVVTLPKLGESVTEGVIGSVFKHVGDEVEFDDALFEVSTDKVDTEVPSSYDGVVLEVLAQEGDTVAVGAAIMRIGGKGTPVATGSLPPHTASPRPVAGRSTTASAPSVGGSEGPTTEGADFSPSAAGEVLEITMPKLGESVTRAPAAGSRPSATPWNSTTCCSTCPPTRWIRSPQPLRRGRSWPFW